MASVPPLLNTSVHPLRDSENAYVSVFSNKNAQFQKNTTLRISSDWWPESSGESSPSPPFLKHHQAQPGNDTAPGATLTEHFGSPSLKLRNGILISILEQQCSDNTEHSSRARGKNKLGWKCCILGPGPRADYQINTLAQSYRHRTTDTGLQSQDYYRH